MKVGPVKPDTPENVMDVIFEETTLPPTGWQEHEKVSFGRVLVGIGEKQGERESMEDKQVAIADMHAQFKGMFLFAVPNSSYDIQLGMIT